MSKFSSINIRGFFTTLTHKIGSIYLNVKIVIKKSSFVRNRRCFETTAFCTFIGWSNASAFTWDIRCTRRLHYSRYIRRNAGCNWRCQNLSTPPITFLQFHKVIYLMIFSFKLNSLGALKIYIR